MKNKIIIFVVLLGISFFIFKLLNQDKIISWYVNDINGDSKDELITITKEKFKNNYIKEIDLVHGDYLNIYFDFKLENNYPKITSPPAFTKKLTDIKPYKIQSADVDGDGNSEISLSVYKKADLHPVMAKRPFFYNYDFEENVLKPKWLGSRLSRPFYDYALFDINNDNLDELISIEYDENKNKILTLYRWQSFGFEFLASSETLEGQVDFLNANNFPISNNLKILYNGINYVVQLDSSGNNLLLVSD